MLLSCSVSTYQLIDLLLVTVAVWFVRSHKMVLPHLPHLEVIIPCALYRKSFSFPQTGHAMTPVGAAV